MYCLYQLLERSRHVVKLQVLKYLTKYYEQCQNHGQSPTCFAFNRKNNIDFNYNVIVDIIYIEGKLVLNFIDEATRFQAERLLKNVLAVKRST